MGWVDKAHKKAKVDKMVETVMNSPKYKEALKKDMEQAALQGLRRFCFLACEFLELRHGYKHNGLEGFLDWTRCRVQEIGEDETYFEDAEKYYKEYHNLDVLKELGMRIERSEEGKT